MRLSEAMKDFKKDPPIMEEVFIDDPSELDTSVKHLHKFITFTRGWEIPQEIHNHVNFHNMNVQMETMIKEDITALGEIYLHLPNIKKEFKCLSMYYHNNLVSAVDDKIVSLLSLMNYDILPNISNENKLDDILFVTIQKNAYKSNFLGIQYSVLSNTASLLFDGIKVVVEFKNGEKIIDPILHVADY